MPRYGQVAVSAHRKVDRLAQPQYYYFESIVLAPPTSLGILTAVHISIDTTSCGKPIGGTGLDSRYPAPLLSRLSDVYWPLLQGFSAATYG